MKSDFEIAKYCCWTPRRLKMSCFEVIVLVACFCVLNCMGSRMKYPSKTENACSSLLPRLVSVQPQHTEPPYYVSAVRNGGKVRVKIGSSYGETFEGFALQARSNVDKTRMINGRFTKLDGISAAADCFDQKENTLTHVNSMPKQEIVTDWTPNNDEKEEIIFRATVMKTISVFWTEIDSPPVRLSDISARKSRQMHSTSTIPTEYSNQMYDICFVGKGCFGLPSGCISRKDCKILLSYSAVMDGIEFQMSGYLEPLSYMAVGISKDNIMGDDFVTECFPKGSSVVLRESWNTGHFNEQTREVSRDKYSGNVANGITTCSWKKNFLIESNGRRFDLENSTYHLLIAKGSMENGRLMYHDERIASSEPVSFTAFQANAENASDSTFQGGTEESTISGADESNVIKTNSSVVKSSGLLNFHWLLPKDSKDHYLEIAIV